MKLEVRLESGLVIKKWPTTGTGICAWVRAADDILLSLFTTQRVDTNTFSAKINFKLSQLRVSTHAR